jgi:hypothetical protein
MAVGARDRVLLKRETDVELHPDPSPAQLGGDPTARRRRRTMETVGLVATLVGAGCVLFGTVVFVRSLPDIAHYRRLRKM